MNSELLHKIHSRGYWQVTIRPTLFEQKLIPDIALLYPLLEQTSVSFIGWPFPFLNEQDRPIRGNGYVSQEFEWNHYLELWRIFQSGQFFHLSSIGDDWLDQSSLMKPFVGWEPGKFIYLSHILSRFTEVFEFTSRLVLNPFFDKENKVSISVLIKGLEMRSLYSNTPSHVSILIRGNLTSKVSEFQYSETFTKEDIVSNADDLAISAARELYQLFNWDPTKEFLKSMQEQLRSRQ